MSSLDMMGKIETAVCLLLAIGYGVVSADEGKKGIVYQNDFSQAVEGQLSNEFLVMEGNFSVEKTNVESYLKLSPTPLVDSSVQFGKSFSGKGLIRVRVKAERQGRRSPRFGVGLYGVSGFQFSVVPSEKKIVLSHGTEVVQSTTFKWRSGEWHFVELTVLETGNNWTVFGRVWAESEERPDAAQVEYIADVELMKGRAYVSGMPSSGSPIYYDDIEVQR